MAKAPKKAERKQKLKVFRTPIGFHDAYVAAPSQKAALEAWGADSNIFAQGIAEQVTDPKLMEEALANPGKVIKKVRGSADEHVAALGKQATPSPRSPAASRPLPQGERVKKAPKPSRVKLEAAEEALETAEKKQRKELRKLDERMQALERELRELKRKHEKERDKLTDKRDGARATYDQAMRKWRDG
jgi:hypothetical protein